MLYNGPGLVTSGANLGGYATPSFFFDIFRLLFLIVRGQIRRCARRCSLSMPMSRSAHGRARC